MKSATAAERMTRQVPTAKPGDTIADVETMLLKRAKDFETINYIYVTDESERLVGVLSVKEIFRSPKQAAARDLMNAKLITAHPGTHQERIAILALTHNLKAVPVVTKGGTFEGVVSSDEILKILHEEHIEDALRGAGIIVSRDRAKDSLASSTLTHFGKRMPWLVLGLVGGLIAAFLVDAFEHALREMLILAAFIPAVVYMADAVGAQTQTLFIRNLALDQELELKRYIGRELRVGVAIAAVLGLAMAAILLAWWEPPTLGAILGLSFFATIVAASSVALFLPWLFLRAKIDPAIATGPFATVVRDILSLLIYFGVASVILAR